MDLYLCEDCGHGQLLDIVSPEILFGNYIYTTSGSPGLAKYFTEYARDIFTQLTPQPGDKVLDIGSNDGTLLRCFQELGLSVLGVDPAEAVGKQAIQSGIPTICAFFNQATALKLRDQWGQAQIVTANNVFAHSDDLGDMAEGVREMLAPNGTFVFEVSYLLDIIQNMIFDFIYHEHLSHHSVKPLKQFLAKHRLSLIKVVRTPSKGGSIRCFARHLDEGHPQDASVQELIEKEEFAGLYLPDTFASFAAKIDAIGLALREFLTRAKNEGKVIAAYGASATGTVLIHHFRLGSLLNYIVDDNESRQGRFSPGDFIPVVSADVLSKTPPDIVLILAWRFADMIIEKNKTYKDSGGTFLVPLPKFSII
jgi:SAM-dependent methyltransferase